jgi:hypothetical protein
MDVFVNGERSEARCLLYENNEELLQLNDYGLLCLDQHGNRAIIEPKIVEIEEKNKDIVIHIDGKRKYQLKNAKRQTYDTN